MSVCLFLSSAGAFGQLRTTALGLCYRPVFPVGFLGTGTEKYRSDGTDFSLGMNHGFSGGMVIRRGFTSLLSGEIGINYVKRNYTYSVTDNTYLLENSFRMIGYELPVSVLAFVQLGERTFMNGSLGAGLDAFASSVAAGDAYTQVIAVKRHTAFPSLNANLGWEFRTYNTGTVYLGATYHRPFQDVCDISILYRSNGQEKVYRSSLSGSYLTADLRFYFNGQQDTQLKKSSKRKGS